MVKKKKLNKYATASETKPIHLNTLIIKNIYICNNNNNNSNSNNNNNKNNDK